MKYFYNEVIKAFKYSKWYLEILFYYFRQNNRKYKYYYQKLILSRVGFPRH
jgi:hypothetical protein